MFVSDPALVDPALAAIADEGLPAAEAIEQAAAKQADVLAALEDEYFRARATEAQPGVAAKVRAIRLLGELDRFTSEYLRLACTTLVCQ